VIADEHASTAEAKGVNGEVDGMMCAIALQNAAVVSTSLLGKDHPAVAECLAQAPSGHNAGRRRDRVARAQAQPTRRATIGSGRPYGLRGGLPPL
jgi:hypothetical protein